MTSLGNMLPTSGLLQPNLGTDFMKKLIALILLFTVICAKAGNPTFPDLTNVINGLSDNPLSKILNWKVQGTQQTYQTEGVATKNLLYCGAGTNGVVLDAWIYIVPTPNSGARSNINIQIFSGAGNISDLDNPPNANKVFDVQITSLFGNAYGASDWFQIRDFAYGDLYDTLGSEIIHLKLPFAFTNGVYYVIRDVKNNAAVSVFAYTDYVLTDPTVLPYWNWKLRSSTASANAVPYPSGNNTNLFTYLNVGGSGIQVGMLVEFNGLNTGGGPINWPEANWSWWLNGVGTNSPPSRTTSGTEDLFSNGAYWSLGIQSLLFVGTTYDFNPGSSANIIETFKWFSPVEAPYWTNGGCIAALPITASNLQSTITTIYYGDTNPSTNWVDGTKKYGIIQNTNTMPLPIIGDTNITAYRVLNRYHLSSLPNITPFSFNGLQSALPGRQFRGTSPQTGTNLLFTLLRGDPIWANQPRNTANSLIWTNFSGAFAVVVNDANVPSATATTCVIGPGFGTDDPLNLSLAGFSTNIAGLEGDEFFITLAPDFSEGSTNGISINNDIPISYPTNNGTGLNFTPIAGRIMEKWSNDTKFVITTSFTNAVYKTH